MCKQEDDTTEHVFAFEERDGENWDENVKHLEEGEKIIEIQKQESEAKNGTGGGD